MNFKFGDCAPYYGTHALTIIGRFKFGDFEKIAKLKISPLYGIVVSFIIDTITFPFGPV